MMRKKKQNKNVADVKHKIENERNLTKLFERKLHLCTGLVEYIQICFHLFNQIIAI